MASIEDLVHRVQQATTETERQWILLELQMNQMPDELVSMLWAAAVPHFFNTEMLRALRPELADEAEKLYQDLEKLTFVEEFPGQGLSIHELTREVLLNQLWQQNQREFLELSKRAADYLFKVETGSEEIEVEFCYNEILNEGTTQAGRLLDKVIDWWTYNKLNQIESAIQRLSEHEKVGRLDSFGRGFLLHLNGLIKMYSANYKEAEATFNYAQTIYKDLEMEDKRYKSSLLRDIGSVKARQGNIEEAVSLAQKAFKLSEENGSDLAKSLNNLAGLYQEAGRYQEAEPLYNRTLKIWEKQLGENHPNVAASLNNLAELYRETGRYQDAELLHNRALKIWEKQLGGNHPNVAVSLNNLAALYEEIGRYQDAESLFNRALKIREKQLGDNHPDVATSLNNLATLYQKQERYEEAILLLERWQIIKHNRKEDRDYNYAENINSLGRLYEKTKQLHKALEAYKAALVVFQQGLGSNHLRVRVLQGEMKRLRKRMKAQAYQDKMKRLRKRMKTQERQDK